MKFLWPRVPHRHLIGPTFFPVYLLVLKVALVVTLVVTAGFAVLGPTGDAESRPRFVEVLIFLVRRGLVAFGATTLALPLSTSGNRAFSADELGSASPASCGTTRRSRVPTRLADSAGAFVWRTRVAVARALLSILIFGGAARVLELTSIWSAVYVPMVVLTAAQVGFHAMNYMRPYWTPARSVARILLRLGTLLLWVTLLTADTWVAANAA